MVDGRTVDGRTVIRLTDRRTVDRQTAERLTDGWTVDGHVVAGRTDGRLTIKRTNQVYILLGKEMEDRFGQEISPDNFPYLNLEDTLLYEIYENNITDVKGGLAGNTKEYNDPDMATGLDLEVPTPEINDNYVNALVLLPRRHSCAREKVIGRKRDAYENDVGRTNENPILNTREYRAEFDDWEVRKMTANVILESMYDACDD